VIFQNFIQLLKAVELPLEKNECCICETNHQSGRERKKEENPSTQEGKW